TSLRCNNISRFAAALGDSCQGNLSCPKSTNVHPKTSFAIRIHANEKRSSGESERGIPAGGVGGMLDLVIRWDLRNWVYCQDARPCCQGGFFSSRAAFNAAIAVWVVTTRKAAIAI